MEEILKRKLQFNPRLHLPVLRSSLSTTNWLEKLAVSSCQSSNRFPPRLPLFPQKPRAREHQRQQNFLNANPRPYDLKALILNPMP